MNLCSNLQFISISHIKAATFLLQLFLLYDKFLWLFGRYPKLEYFLFISDMKYEFDGFSRFSVENPNIRTFATSEMFLWKNRDQFLNSKVKLDILEIRIIDVYDIRCHQECNSSWEKESFWRTYNRRVFSKIKFFHNQIYSKFIQVKFQKELIILKGLERIDLGQNKDEFWLNQVFYTTNSFLYNKSVLKQKWIPIDFDCWTLSWTQWFQWFDISQRSFCWNSILFSFHQWFLSFATLELKKKHENLSIFCNIFTCSCSTLHFWPQ